MVAANKNLLKEVRRLAIKEGLLAMKLRGGWWCQRCCRRRWR
jgi:hypothetical protein